MQRPFGHFRLRREQPFQEPTLNIPHRLMTRNLPFTVGITASKDPIKDPDLARGLGDATNFLQAGGHTAQIVVLCGTKESVAQIKEATIAFVMITDPEKKLGLEVSEPISRGDTFMLSIRSTKNSDEAAPRDVE